MTDEEKVNLANLVDKAGYKGQMTIEIDTENVCVSGEAAKDEEGNYTQTPCNYNATNDGHHEIGYKTVIKKATGQGEFAGK